MKRQIMMTAFGPTALALTLAGFVLSGAAHAQNSEEAPASPSNETICDDGTDNDGDTVFDCGDSDCKDAPNCKRDGDPENTEARCSDFIDNDGNGHIDCEDEDCLRGRFKVCQGSWDTEEGKSKQPQPGAYDDVPDGNAGTRMPTEGDVDGGYENIGIRFSIVSQISQLYDIEEDTMDTRFTVLQLRALGPIPFIQDSFFLVSMRAERTPRLTFAMFQIPLGDGHYLNINSGGGGLSTALIRSATKQLLIDSPFYLYNAFEQGNGAALEVGGPIDDKGVFDYRVYVAGGSGRGNGNVGGRFFTFDNTNYTWTVGAQFGIDFIGNQTRWDSPLLYVPVPTAFGMTVGIKYDERAQERFPATNVNLTLRTGRFIGSAETYIKRELEFGSWQVAYNIAAGFLIVPKYLLFAADVGEYIPGDFDNPPALEETDIRRQLEEFQWRVGLHWYFWRNIGVISAIYSDRTTSPRGDVEPDTHERIFKFVGQYRF